MSEDKKITVGYQLYTGISTLLTSLLSLYALATNDLHQEYLQSKDVLCKNMWYYLISITIVSGCVGLFICGYLFYYLLCKGLCGNDVQMNFTCSRCIYLVGYIFINLWGYFVVISTEDSCLDDLEKNFKLVFIVLILFNVIFTINVFYLIVLLFRKSRCCKGDKLIDQRTVNYGGDKFVDIPL